MYIMYELEPSSVRVVDRRPPQGNCEWDLGGQYGELQQEQWDGVEPRTTPHLQGCSGTMQVVMIRRGAALTRPDPEPHVLWRQRRNRVCLSSRIYMRRLVASTTRKRLLLARMIKSSRHE